MNIQRNDYVEDTTIREEVVEGICQALLDGCVWSRMYPRTTSPYRRASKFIVKRKGDSQFYGFHSASEISSNDEGVKFNRFEFDKAIKILREYGYFVWYVSCEWSFIIVTKKPYCNYDGARPITEFKDYID